MDIPSDLAIGPDGVVYVADYGRQLILRYNLAGRFLGSFGKPGRGPGEFLGPRDIAFDRQGHIFIIDSINCRIQEWAYPPAPKKKN